jgi:hypothetical protein
VSDFLQATFVLVLPRHESKMRVQDSKRRDLRRQALVSGVRRAASACCIAVLALGCSQILESPDAKFAGPLRFESYLKSPDVQSLAEFGYSVALDASSLATTAPFEDSVAADGTPNADTGALYVFDLGQRLAEPLHLVAPNAEPGDGLFPGKLLPSGAFSMKEWGGMFVGLDRDWIALGVCGEDSGLTPSASIDVAAAQTDNGAAEAGAVYLYRRSNLLATPQYIKAPNPEAGDLFGFSVAVSGEWLAVGAVGEASADPDHSANDAAAQSGAVYMYRYDTERDGFVFRQYLKAPRIHEGDIFGNALALDGDLLAVGASLEDGAGTGLGADYEDVSSHDTGAVYTYRWNGERWSFEAYLKPAVLEPGAGFGNSLQVAGDRIAVGSPGASKCPGDAGALDLAGVAYVIEKQNGQWSDDQCLSAGDRSADSLFGISVGMYGDRLVVGAPWAPPRKSGSAYLFERNASGAWRERTSITSPNPDETDVFGVALSISSKTIAIGAINESGGESGPDANPSSNSAIHAGAVYVFSAD